MSSGGNAARLAALTRELLLRWQQACGSWNDVKTREFEARFLRPLESAVKSAVPRLERLEAILRKVHDDCE